MVRAQSRRAVRVPAAKERLQAIVGRLQLFRHPQWLLQRVGSLYVLGAPRHPLFGVALLLPQGQSAHNVGNGLDVLAEQSDALPLFSLIEQCISTCALDQLVPGALHRALPLSLSLLLSTLCGQPLLLQRSAAQFHLLQDLSQVVVELPAFAVAPSCLSILGAIDHGEDQAVAGMAVVLRDPAP